MSKARRKNQGEVPVGRFIDAERVRFNGDGTVDVIVRDAIAVPVPNRKKKANKARKAKPRPKKASKPRKKKKNAQPFWERGPKPTRARNLKPAKKAKKAKKNSARKSKSKKAKKAKKSKSKR